MRTGSRILMWLVCGLLVIGGAAFAQDVGAGPVKLSVSLRAEYTDNRDSLDEPNDEDTWDFYVKPRLDLFLDGERSLLDLFYAPSVRHRTDPSDSQNDEEVHHDLGVYGEMDLSPSVTIRATQKLDITDDSEIDEDGATIRRDESYTLSRTLAGINSQMTRSTDVDVSGYFMDKSFDEDDVAEDSDETRADVQLASTTIMSPSLSVSGKLRYSDFGFDNADGLQRDFESVLVGVGCEKALSASLRAGATLGLQTQTYDDDGIDTENVPYVDLWLRGQTIPSTRVTGQIEHGLRDADVYPYASQEYTDLRATVEVEVSPRVELELTGIYRRSDYEDALPDSTPADLVSSLPDENGTEDRYIAQAAVAYKFSEASSLRLTQRYEDLDSDVGESFTKNTTRLVYGREF